jgi:flavin-dependent dehydrogenase
MKKISSNTSIKMIVIIGGGVAGLSTAYALLKQGFQITLLEASHYQHYTAGEHLTAQGIQAFKQLGIPAEVWEKHAIPCYQVASAWGDQQLHTQLSIFNPYGAGVLLSRPAFDQELANFVQQAGGNIIHDARVTQIQQQASARWTIQYKQTALHDLEADFLIDASGRNTKFAAYWGAKKIQYDDLIGISLLSNLKTTHNQALEQGAILIEAIEQGWWYSTVLAKQRVVATFMTDADLAKSQGSIQQSLQHFITASIQTQQHLPQGQLSHKIYTASAKSQYLSHMVGEHCLAVGDAAWSADPLSSQGLYKAIIMAQQAADAINAYSLQENLALINYENTAQRAFFNYIQEKSQYYQMETRWQQADFWQRRHLPTWLDQPISLDPQGKVSINHLYLDKQIQQLKYITPTINLALLVNILKTPLPAYHAVNQYKQLSNSLANDREIIIAIQYLN